MTNQELFYKLIPVTIDESIMILDECTLIYKTKSKNTPIVINFNINSSNNCSIDQAVKFAEMIKEQLKKMGIN